MMNPDRWQQVKKIFDAALKLAPGERVRFLDENCSDDKILRQEVEKLLDSFADDSFLEQPAAREVASVIIKAGTKHLEAGKCFGHYQVIRQIGAGGMGEVYLAQDKKLDRLVAVKILNENFAQHESNLRRFTQEAKAASALNHPNILVIHEIGESEDANYIVSEFVEGKTLRDSFKESAMKFSEVLDIAIQIANALTAAHTAHIVHRDIKPENIMVRSDGYAKILDFGLAKLVEQKVIGLEDATVKQNETAKGVILGTVNYMSPEQAKGERVDKQTDIFSFGVLIYEMITGRTPFAGNTMSETFANLINTEPQPLSRFSEGVPDELQRIVSKTLRKNKHERYQMMKDVLTDLKSLQKRLEFEAELERSSSPDKQWENRTQFFKADTGGNKQTTAQTKSIAVLPFANMSADAENEYFCDGLAEELLNALSKIEDLNVAARTSAFSFKGKNTNVSEIGNILNVNTILEGSVRKSGKRLRITVQLVNAANGYHLWSERYDRDMKDIFEVQDEITLAVVDALKIKLLGEEKAAIIKRYTDNAEVYELYLKGRFCLNNDYLNSSTQNDLQKAIGYFQEAVSIDQNYAPAFAGLADAYTRLSTSGDTPPTETMPKAREAAQKALALDNDLSEAHTALGIILCAFDYDFAGAERECKLAVKLNPNYAAARERYGGLLAALGRHEEADAEYRRALEIDPLSFSTKMKYCQFLFLARRYDESIAQLKKILELNPNFPMAKMTFAVIYEAQDKYAEAIEEIAEFEELFGVAEHAVLIRESFAKGGWQGFLKDRMNFISQQANLPSTLLASTYASVGEKDKAFAELDKAYENRESGLTNLKVDPNFDRLRDDPRFQDLLRRIGFPTGETAQVRTTGEADAKTLEAKAITDLTAQPQISKSFVTDNSKNQKYVFIISLIILLLAAGGFGYYFWSAKKSASSATGKKSLAVLPFVNASQDPNAEYLSDGITESVINNLSQMTGLRVMSRNSAFRFKSNQSDTRNIASQLGVETLVTGDIKQLGDKLIINVRLIDASDDSQIWGNQYVKTSDDVIVAQNEIAQAVAQNLRLKLTNSEQRQLGKNYTKNAEAYELYLRGRFHYFKITQPEIRKAIGFFERAIELDPNYALAYAGMADAYRTLPIAYGTSSKEGFPQAKAAALRALEIDPQLAEARIVLGWIGFMFDWDWAAAESELKRAIEIAPNNSDAHRTYAHLLSNMARHDEAVAEVKRARELDPLSLITNALEGQFLFYAGRIDEAFDRYKKTLEIEPNFWIAHNGLARIYIRQKRWEEAIAALTKAKELSGGSTEPITQMGYALAKSGNRERAQFTLEELKSVAKENYVPAYSFAIIYNGLGEKDEALKYLEKSFEEREAQMAFIKIDTRWDWLRAEPRFVEIIKQINLE